MSPQLVAILAQISAAQARVLGMQAQNQQSAASGESPAYVFEHFEHEADLLAHLADAARHAH